jgi:phage terminase small subunit
MTPRQKRFVDEYLRDANGTRAAIRAGYAEVSARHHAHNLLRRPEIAAAIAEAEAARAERLRVSADRVLEELARVAFADLTRLVEWGPEGATVKAWGSVPGDETAAVAEVVVGPAGVRLRLHDKLRALDALCRHLGLYRRPGPGMTTPPVEAEADDGTQAKILERLDQLAAELEGEER